MHAEIISIGDELTSGQRLDTNSQWLSTRLGELGVQVMYHTTVADDLAANVQVFRQAAERADLVIATGGLGPTADDLTRDAIAAAAAVELIFDAAAFAHIENLFARRKRAMPERNRVQAMFPRGSRVIPNPAGTAPGIDIDLPRAGRAAARIFALPGVPAEMHEMWEQTVAPAISKMIGAPRVIRHRQIKCFGVGESDLEQMLPDLIRRGRDPQVGITVSGATITLRITASGETPQACYLAMAPTIATIHDCLGDLVFGEGDDELEHAVVKLLDAQQKTLATAEWGSGGMIAHWLSEVPGSRDLYLGGLVTNSREFPGPPLDMITDIDPSIPAGGKRAIAMATVCREKFHSDYGLSVGELPAVVPTASEPPQFWYAVATPEKVVVKSSPYAGHPDILKARGGKQALNLLRLTLLRAARKSN
jgi:nicotinamide-nucleotide amidase